MVEAVLIINAIAKPISIANSSLGAPKDNYKAWRGSHKLWKLRTSRCYCHSTIGERTKKRHSLFTQPIMWMWRLAFNHPVYDGVERCGFLGWPPRLGIPGHRSLIATGCASRGRRREFFPHGRGDSGDRAARHAGPHDRQRNSNHRSGRTGIVNDRRRQSANIH